MSSSNSLSRAEIEGFLNAYNNAVSNINRLEADAPQFNEYDGVSFGLRQNGGLWIDDHGKMALLDTAPEWDLWAHPGFSREGFQRSPLSPEQVKGGKRGPDVVKVRTIDGHEFTPLPIDILPEGDATPVPAKVWDETGQLIYDEATGFDLRKSSSTSELQPLPVEQKKSPFKVVAAADFSIDDLPDPLVEGAIIKNTVHVFYGATQAGKTFVTIDLALCLATGRSWFDREIDEPVAVLWVSAEDAPGVRLRVIAWCKYHGVDRARVPFLTIEGNVFNLRNATTQDEIVKAGEDLLTNSGLKHIAVVIDTLARSTPGADEKSGKDMSEVTDAFDRLRFRLPATLIVIDHTGKDESKGIRGHSSKMQGLDSYALVKQTAGKHFVDFGSGVGKVKNYGRPAKIGFSLHTIELAEDRKGRPITSCVVVPRSISAAELGPVALDARAKEFRDALARLVSEEGTLLPNALGEGTYVTEERWREACYASLPGKANSKRKLYTRTRNGLYEVGAVLHHDHGDGNIVWLPALEGEEK
jgi:hypothetical protein